MKKKNNQFDEVQETRIDFRGTHTPEFDETTRQTVQVGSVLKKRFILEEVIARGGMGVVYKAKDLRKVEAMERNPYIAIKVLSEDFKQHPESWIALQRETRKTQQLSHPNIITVYDFDRDESNVFMTMELLEGEPLTELLDRISNTGLPYKKAIPLIKGMGQALKYAHQHDIVHSDFKPGNVFITHNNIVKVLDFGIARAIIRPNKRDDETIFNAGSLGALTPPYASYEMLNYDDPDPSDDIYALACVAYELLAGKHPFNKKTAVNALNDHLKVTRIKQLNSKQNKGLTNGLALRRKDRTATVERFLNEIQYQSSNTLKIAAIYLFLISLVVSAGYYGYQFLEQEQWEEHINALESIVQEGQLTFEQTNKAALQLEEMNVLIGKNARLEKIRDDLAFNYLNLASIAQDNQQWQIARESLALAQELEPGKNIVELLRSRLNEINKQDDLLQTITDLETRFGLAFSEMQVEPDSIKYVLTILDQLAVIAPQHPLINEGRNRVEVTLSTAVREYAQRQQWQAGLQIADDLLNIIPTSSALLAVKQDLVKDYQSRLSEDIDALESIVQESQLTLEQTNEAALQLEEMSILIGKNTRLEKIRDDLAFSYLNLAAIAQENQQWQTARDALALAQELKPNKNIIDLLYTRQIEINKQKDLLLTVTDLEARFELVFSEMQVDPDSIKNALTILNQLAAIVPQHPLINEGRNRVANKLAAAVRDFAQRRQWQEGLKLADDLLIIMPSSSVLLAARKELENGYQAKLNQDKKITAEKAAKKRSKELQNAKVRVETLINHPKNSTAWYNEVEQELRVLKKRLPKKDPWLNQMQTSFNNIKGKQQSSKWKDAFKSKGAEQTD